MASVRLVGPGRAGSSLARALARRGWEVRGLLGRRDDPSLAAADVDLLVLSTPDEVVEDLASRVEPVPTTLVVHLSGSLGLEVLSPHPRSGFLHPLVPLPDPSAGAERLLGGAYFAVAGDPGTRGIVEDLGGHPIEVPSEKQTAYHAAACIASNHLVALLGQVERVAAAAGVPFDAFVPLARSALEDVARFGPEDALTGPVRRGDWSTVERHRASLEAGEIDGYDAGVRLAARLASGREERPVRAGRTGVAAAPHEAGVSQPGQSQGAPGAGEGRGASGASGLRGGVSLRVMSGVRELSGALEAARRSGRSVGLVPTMGALHAGHLSLVERARRECDVVVVSIFVNPLQFGPGEDLDTYPRDTASDLAKLASAGADIAFVPTVEEMYPSSPATSVRVGGISEVLEGASRPLHFNGVATVVAKLFAIAGPCRAYFGDKDYQQLLLVKQMARDLSFPVEVIDGPTVRDPDGLALSSRNSRLSASQRASAAALHRALAAGRSCIESGERSVERVRAVMAAVLDASPEVELDYAEVVDASDLTVPDRLEGRQLRLLVAARVGSVRLIDNLPASGPDCGSPDEASSRDDGSSSYESPAAITRLSSDASERLVANRKAAG